MQGGFALEQTLLDQKPVRSDEGQGLPRILVEEAVRLAGADLLEDLAPLIGMQLTKLDCIGTSVGNTRSPKGFAQLQNQVAVTAIGRAVSRSILDGAAMRALAIALCAVALSNAFPSLEDRLPAKYN